MVGTTARRGGRGEKNSLCAHDDSRAKAERLSVRGWASGGLPFIEESEDVFGRHGAGVLEFAALLAENEFAGGIENGERGHAFRERHFVLLGDIEIFVEAADVHVDDDEGSIERWRNLGAVKGLVENVAIETPIPAKNQ
jgi:hypothetical protein